MPTNAVRGATANHTAPPARTRSSKPMVRQTDGAKHTAQSSLRNSSPERPSRMNVKA